MKNVQTSMRQADDIGQAMQALIFRVRRLCPDHRDPHRFHEEKSEIAHELMKLARRFA